MKHVWHKGDRIHFDPALSVTTHPTALFKTPRVHCTVTNQDDLYIEDDDVTLASWQLEGDDGSVFWLVDDKPSELWFLLRLVAETDHTGQEPAWMKGEEYGIATPTGAFIQFGHYSPVLIAQHGQDLLLLRIYVRAIEDSEEFLWIMLQNDDCLQHWVGVVIDPAQILPG